jgi:hypothetical protein
VPGFTRSIAKTTPLTFLFRVFIPDALYSPFRGSIPP